MHNTAMLACWYTITLISQHTSTTAAYYFSHCDSRGTLEPETGFNVFRTGRGMRPTFNISARRVAPLSPMLLPVRFSFLMAASPAAHLAALMVHI